MAGPWNRPDLTQEALDRETQIFADMKARANSKVYVHTVQPVTVRVLESLVKEFEAAGVVEVPVHVLRDVINKIKAEEQAANGNSPR